MLSAHAVRLAAIEILRPTAAVLAGTGFPTLAGANVLDSRQIAIGGLTEDADYTPVLSVYTMDSTAQLRGPMTGARDTAADTILDIVAELAVAANDGGEPFADAMAGSDPEGCLVLGALCAQVRYQLERSDAGLFWRHLVRQVEKIDYLPFGAPELGIRYQRITMRMHLSIRDDDFQTATGGLPEPIRTVHAALPAQSYAKAKLTELAAHFAAVPTTPLTTMRGEIGAGGQPDEPGETTPPG
ncbi:hypothetical protein [Rhizobium sp. RU36D]|uniref:hypothetical protein n=1 Tax=Rhizobium sp. RU36D TaxID=1907415 RepID=UPI0009D8B84E|nr:hypothetical protein [Rhizobium sp. RU36D]SMD18497.1 hypothetical protein SAMN05880593_13519 [Rhizobium sp. RU36D]